MSTSAQPGQRNALAPGLIAAAVVLLGPVLTQLGWGQIVLYVTSIFALIIAWFAWKAGHWWWLIVLIPIAVLWNPIYPLPFSGIVWTVAQWAAAAVFLACGALIRTPRT